MCCKSLWKTIVPFAIALMLGVLTASLFQKIVYHDENQNAIKSAETKIYSGTGSGIGSGSGGSSKVEIEFIPRAGTNPVRVISKSRPNYTDAARQNQVTGVVRLKVTFLASGQIGSVSPVTGLPDGLTEEAIKAARKIRFQPATVDGKAVSVSKVVEYNFTIY